MLTTFPKDYIFGSNYQKLVHASLPNLVSTDAPWGYGLGYYLNAGIRQINQKSDIITFWWGPHHSHFSRVSGKGNMPLQWSFITIFES